MRRRKSIPLIDVSSGQEIVADDIVRPSRRSAKVKEDDKLETLGILADQYVNLRENMKVLDESKSELSDKLKKLVTAVGEEDESGTYTASVRRGTRTITVKNIMVVSSVLVDEAVEILQEKLPERLKRKVLTVTTSINMQELERLVAKGKITPELVDELIKEGPAYHRLDVREVQDKAANKLHKVKR